MSRDQLFLLKSGFSDPAYPGKQFYCGECAIIEGVLAYHPELALLLEIERVDWPRPRARILGLVGEENQSLPLLILSGEGHSGLSVKSRDGVFFINEINEILRALSLRHGISDLHP